VFKSIYKDDEEDLSKWINWCLLHCTDLPSSAYPVNFVLFFPSEGSDFSMNSNDISILHDGLIIHAKCKGECVFYAKDGTGVWHLKAMHSIKNERCLTMIRWEKNPRKDKNFQFKCLLFLPLFFKETKQLDFIYAHYTSIDVIVLMNISHPVLFLFLQKKFVLNFYTCSKSRSDVSVLVLRFC